MTTPTPIAIVAPHGSGWGVVVSGCYLIHLNDRTTAVAVAAALNGTCAGLAMQCTERGTALMQLIIEAVNFRDMGGDPQYLTAAIEEGKAVLKRGEDAP